MVLNLKLVQLYKVQDGVYFKTKPKGTSWEWPIFTASGLSSGRTGFYFDTGEDFLCVTGWTRGRRELGFHNNGSVTHTYTVRERAPTALRWWGGFTFTSKVWWDSKRPSSLTPTSHPSWCSGLRPSSRRWCEESVKRGNSWAKMRILLSLLCVLCATPSDSIFEGTCLRKGEFRVKVWSWKKITSPF